MDLPRVSSSILLLRKYNTLADGGTMKAIQGSPEWALLLEGNTEQTEHVGFTAQHLSPSPHAE